MKHVWSRIVILTAVTAMTLCPAPQADDETQGKQSETAAVSQTRYRAATYAIPLDPTYLSPTTTTNQQPFSAPVLTSSTMSPGLIVGYTWYDWQHNGSMGRMIETGPHPGETGYAIVHMGWTYLPDKQSADSYRSYAYAAYRSEDHALIGPVIVMPEEEDNYGGYVNVDITRDNRAILGGHNLIDYLNVPEFYYDGGSAYGTFPNVDRIPDSTLLYNEVVSASHMWPKFFFQYGSDTVFHVIAADFHEAPLMWHMNHLKYFRKVGFEGAATSVWDYPPYVIDTVQPLAHDVIGTRTGDRVAIAWTASLPYDEPDCDTCSGISFYDGSNLASIDNDVYYQLSSDQGATWEPRVNLTKVTPFEAAWKAGFDLSLLFDSSDNLHIVWPACPWPEDFCPESGGFCFAEDWYPHNARLFHWSESFPYIRTIADQSYEWQATLLDSCLPGGLALRIAKPSISECEGKLYALWTQFNDPRNGIIDDCAEWGYDDVPSVGATNGDLYLSVSDDLGGFWSLPFNITNSYTPRCDPKFGEECQSDYWPSMTRLGRENQPDEDWTAVITIDPSGTYTGDHYLDVMYVNDLDAGSPTLSNAEGSWTDNPIKWFRLACIEPVRYPVFEAEWTSCEASTMVDEQFDTTLGIGNSGNATLTYAIEVEELNGPEGWLEVSGYNGYVYPGVQDPDYVTVHLNKDGVITNAGVYNGILHITGNDPFNLPADITIELTVEGPSDCCEVMGKFYNDGEPFSILDLDNWIEWMLRNPGVPPGPDCPAQLDIRDTTICVWAGNVCIGPDGYVDILDLDAWIECLLRDPWSTPCPAQCPEVPEGCCVLKGDFDHNGVVDEDDLQQFAEHLGAVPDLPPCSDPFCCDEMDLDGDEIIGITDLLYLQDYILQGEPVPPPCGEYSGSDDWCHKCLIK
ncbi:MAG: hypothetical protein JSV52_08580 [Candidatus Zixiibacteriota bacterium]|nr:MAG: hypothetical protein JSV52_08580 [candidate division Zixibacteria bacterium]